MMKTVFNNTLMGAAQTDVRALQIFILRLLDTKEIIGGDISSSSVHCYEYL